MEYTAFHKQAWICKFFKAKFSNLWVHYNAKTHNPFRLTEQVNHNGRMKIWINLQALEIEADIQKSAVLPWCEFKSST